MSPYSFQHTAARRRLGWQVKWYGLKDLGFNTQPPEGGWIIPGGCIDTAPPVSTHSRPKAAGDRVIDEHTVTDVSTHSRPKAAGLTAFFPFNFSPVSTHSRPKAAGAIFWLKNRQRGFQHTAARRRLDKHTCLVHICIHVSTHSRPKAAGCFNTRQNRTDFFVSTHSRPKAAGPNIGNDKNIYPVSTHSRPKAAGLQ